MENEFEELVCPQCGESFEDGKFCMKCGAKLQKTKIEMDYFDYADVQLVYGPPPEFANVKCQKCGA